jgi:hypothetical protein
VGGREGNLNLRRWNRRLRAGREGIQRCVGRDKREVRVAPHVFLNLRVNYRIYHDESDTNFSKCDDGDRCSAGPCEKIELMPSRRMEIRRSRLALALNIPAHRFEPMVFLRSVVRSGHFFPTIREEV